MAFRVKKSIAVQLDNLSKGLQGEIDVALKRSRRKRLPLAMALRLEAKLVHQVFGQQQTPEGQPWRGIAPLTLALRAADGRGNRKLGTGPRNALIRSLQVNDPDNLFEVDEGGFVYGSKKVRNGVNVLVGFQSPSRTPKSDDPGKRGRVRAFMVGRVGVPAPGRGRALVKPPRRALSLPPRWMAELLEVGQDITKTTIDDAVAKAMRKADFEVEALRARDPTAAGGIQFF